MKMYKDVKEFHEKFNLPTSNSVPITPLPNYLKDFRKKFLQEELNEFSKALSEDNILEQIDGLLDLIYVAHGTLHMMGLPDEAVEACWDEIQRANMSKERCKLDDERSKRGHSHDVVKPDGWIGPDLKKVLMHFGVIIP